VRNVICALVNTLRKYSFHETLPKGRKNSKDLAHLLLLDPIADGAALWMKVVLVSSLTIGIGSSSSLISRRRGVAVARFQQDL
jgi:hypothetical protein